MNKRGIVALYNQKEDSAMDFWSEGLDLNDRHFDCQLNFVLQRWSTAKIHDE